MSASELVNFKGKGCHVYAKDASFFCNRVWYNAGFDGDINLMYTCQRIWGDFDSLVAEGGWRTMGLWLIYLMDSPLHGIITQKGIAKLVQAATRTDMTSGRVINSFFTVG